MASEPMLAAPPVSIVPRVHVSRATVFSDYWTLTKPDVNLLIAITTASAFGLAVPADSHFPWIRLLNTLAGTALVASGAAALNQWMERRFDARMRRTARRPVAAGRIEAGRALAFGTLTSLAGIAYLLGAVGLLPSLLATATLLGYLLLYTPAKRGTPLCTLIGAVPGAIPPLIGWAAARGRIDPEAWVLFAIVFLWQFPHFMAIAWMYRDDYDRAGYRVLPHGDESAPFVVLLTLLPLVGLAFASLLPLVGQTGYTYGVGALVLGFAFLYCAVRFVHERSGQNARQLLLVSIVYLPALLVLRLVATPVLGG